MYNRWKVLLFRFHMFGNTLIFYKYGFFWGEEGVFLMKDTNTICRIAQKKYGSSIKICLNHAFSESQKRKKECNSYFKYKQRNFLTWKK